MAGIIPLQKFATDLYLPGRTRFRHETMVKMRVLMGTLFAIGLGLNLTGCGTSFEHLPAGSIAGRDSTYDYSPSVIQSGNVQQIWWCGGAYNPDHRAQWSDTIQYESIDLSTHTRTGPEPVLGDGSSFERPQAEAVF